MASMFEGLLKTPEQIRQEEQKALQDRGLTAAAMLTRGSGGASSALPGLLQGLAGNIAQNIDTSTANLAKRGLGGLGALSGAMGREDLQGALQQAGMSQQEQQAMKAQGIAKAMDSADPKSLRLAAQRFRQAGLAKAAEAAETRAQALEAAKAKAEAAARKEKREERELGIKEETLALSKKKEKRIADAESKGYTTLDADSMLAAGFPQSKIDAGMVVSRGPKNQLQVVFDPKDSKAAPINNVKSVVNSDTNQTTQIGVQNGKLVEITAEGVRPVDFEYNKPVELTGNPTADKLAITKEARAELGPRKKLVQNTDQAIIFANEALKGSPTAEAQLDRFLAKMTGDSNLGVTEINMIASGGSFTSKTSNYINKLLEGTSTEAKLKEKKAAAERLNEYFKNDLNAHIKTFDSNYGDLGVNIDQYRVNASGFSANTLQLMKEMGLAPGE